MPIKNNGKNSRQDVEIARLEERLKAAEFARELAVKDLDRRLEGMNEFRRQLDVQAETFVTRTELQLLEERLSKKTDVNRVSVDWIIRVLILGSLIAIVLNFVK